MSRQEPASDAAAAPSSERDDISSEAASLPQDRLGATSPSLDGAEDPPPYGNVWGHIVSDQSATAASIAADGRINIRIEQNTKGLSSLLVPALRSQLDLNSFKLPAHDQLGAPPPYVPPELERQRDRLGPPALNIVIHVVGSRGDVQPFVALAKVLKHNHGHRVRLATHPVFQDFVEENDIEFFSIGGDPMELMAYMVRNPGLMPGFDTLRSGDVGHRRHEIARMVRGCWRSCFEAGDGTGPEISDADFDEPADMRGSAMDQGAPAPFVADAIIANPPSFAHIHCAEKLGIPLHMMFTMPWSPTQAFPHPLANIQATNAEGNMTNFMSYALVDMMTWQGLGDVINRFREKSLGLEPVSLTWAPGMLARLHIPYTYCWSPALIPKPKDWGSYINISGFYFLEKSGDYSPEPALEEFLKAGPAPVYIGFGSIVVDDPNAMTKLIFDAVRMSGQRALVSKGWGGFGADQLDIPEGVFMIGNVPHDWLFQRVSCVVHHGGAGTTAAGISCGRPTVIVPFFGDQPFWGAMVARAGTGPKPVHSKDLTAETLAQAIKDALEPEILDKARLLSERIAQEKGCEVGAQSFHRQLEMDKLRCQLSPKRRAVWRIRRTDVRLSAFAAALLSSERLLDFKDLKLYRPTEYEPDDGPLEPISGGASALIETMGSMAMGIADMPVATLKALKIHPDARRERAMSSVGSPSTRSRATSSASKRPSTPAGQSPASGTRSQTFSPDRRKGTPENPGRRKWGRSSRSGSQSSSQAVPLESEEAAVAQQVGSEMIARAGGESLERETTTASEGSASTATREPEGRKRQFTFDKGDLETALRTGKGAAMITTAAIKSPMDLTLGLARGFHNAPKLYGDETVRKQEKITDLSSGLKAAGREFRDGVFDGISGLVTQPIAGAKKEGAAGFVKGFGKGIGGVVFKPGAAFWGLPGYTSVGIYREIRKRFGPSVDGYIIAARTAQGYAELRSSSAEERAALVADWKEMRRFIHKRRNIGEEKMQEISERIRKYTWSTGGGGEATDATRSTGRVPMERTTTTGTYSSGVWSPGESETVRNPLSRATTMQSGAAGTEGQEGGLGPEVEEAIRRSVAETSQGNAQQDASIERAIRASIVEMQATEAGSGDVAQTMEDELQAAMQTSLLEPEQGRPGDGGHGSEAKREQAELELALAESRQAHAKSQAERAEAEQDEEAVMRYVMRQSRLEGEQQQQQQQQQQQ